MILVENYASFQSLEAWNYLSPTGRFSKKQEDLFKTQFKSKLLICGGFICSNLWCLLAQRQHEEQLDIINTDLSLDLFVRTIPLHRIWVWVKGYLLPLFHKWHYSNHKAIKSTFLHMSVHGKSWFRWFVCVRKQVSSCIEFNRKCSEHFNRRETVSRNIKLN